MLKKVILLTITCLIIIGAIVAIMLFNKPHRNVANETGIQVSATELCKSYTADETKANTMYLNKALVVTGKVMAVNKNQDGMPVVEIAGSDSSMIVQCTMFVKDVAVDKGKNASIKGICTGSTMFDVQLTDCIIK